ncbi:hypothetical protein JOF29_007110 [Kribbella aluminosa]|uniref:Uncharacterized protein n=1 Tax=Kribbella aluminosa TaxID=416017 RepID=A0ABS4UWG5_9ACTN|nr:hypothetical protein [Kribbella aluminosa]MBP2356000.1 hypothetical protein [Kribbella aluminosa]
MVVTGGYLVWYWYPAATRGTTTAAISGASSGGLARFSATISTWVQAHTTLIAWLAATAVLLAAALTLRYRLRTRNAGRLTAAAHDGDSQRSDADCCAPKTAPETAPQPVPAALDQDRPGNHCC